MSAPTPSTLSWGSARRARPARRTPSRAARRTGYAAGVLVNALLLYAVNVWPGWEAVPFLTDDFRRVLGIVNASMLVGVVTNLVYLYRDTARVRAAGSLLTTGIGLVALVRMWQVFPFDFGGDWSGWDEVFRLMIGVGVVGSVVALVVAVVGLVRGSPPR